jgi:hypothetical protein
VPLSEEELRLLEQMERALVAEDPKFASTLRGTKLRQKARRQVIAGGVVFLGGVALLMSGAVLRMVPLGVLGFVVMLGSAYVTLTAWRGRTAGGGGAFSADEASAAGEAPRLRVVSGGKKSKTRSPRPPKPQGSMMERFEERWRRRRDQNGGM